MNQDYFSQTIGHVKKVLLTYGPQGRSRGIAQITFSDPKSGPKAMEINGTKVDHKPMKIEVILGASQAPAPAAPKGLADRMSQPKTAAKEKNNKTKDKPKTNGAATTNGAAAKSKNRPNKKSGRAGKPKRKTAEELDAEMMDYFGTGAPNGAAQPAAAATGGDTGMVDEVL